MSTPVRAAQRFTRNHPCPICGGHDRLPNGQGIRCYGFLGSDGRYAHCSREEHANGLPQETGGTFSHRLDGQCNCGKTHSADPPLNGRASVDYGYGAPLRRHRRAKTDGADGDRPRHTARKTTYEIADTDGRIMAIHQRTDDSNGEKRMWWERPGGATGLGGLAVEDLPPYGAHAWHPDRPTIHVEGEKARVALAPLAEPLGVNVVGHVTGAPATHSPDALRPILSPRHFLWADSDGVGETQMERTHWTLRELLRNGSGIPMRQSKDAIRRIVWHGARPGEGDDAADFVEQGGTVEALRALLASASVWTDSAEASSPNDSDPGTDGIWLADVHPERVDWLSQGRLARRKTTIIDGDPGLGKSTVVLDLAARITRGLPLPDGPPLGARGVVLMSAEDDAADTIRPRADAAGADVSRILILNERADGGSFAIPRDLPLIEAAIERADAALLVIDPLVAFLDASVNVNRDQDVRRALAPVRAMAERTGVVVLMIRHLNKLQNGNALYRGGGSIGVIGAARFGLTCARDPDNEDRFLIASSKCNLGPMPDTLAYRLVGVPGTDVARVEWDGTSALGANALLAASAGDEDERSATHEAADWLDEYLALGPRPAADILKDAKRAGIAEKTLRSAKSRSGVRAHREGFGPGSRVLWFRPDREPYDDAATDGGLGARSNGGHLCQVWENPDNGAESERPSMADIGGQAPLFGIHGIDHQVIDKGQITAPERNIISLLSAAEAAPGTTWEEL